MDIDTLTELLAEIPPAAGAAWHLKPIVVDRLYASNSPEGRPTLFLLGSADSFGRLPRVAGLSHSDSVVALPADKTVAALRIVSGDDVQGGRAIGHIGYELTRELAKNSVVGNEDLLRSVAWMLPLISRDEPLLPMDRQRGLVGECVLLRRLLLECRQLGLSPVAALDRWWGGVGGKRDFAAHSIAIEAKATSQNSRRHLIGSLLQLEPQSSSERVFLFSVGIKSDPSSPRKLGRVLVDIEELFRDSSGDMDPVAQQQFRDQLAAYGLNWSRLGAYEGQPGFLPPHLPPAIFQADDIGRLRPSSFVGGQLPPAVVNVSYEIDVHAEPLSAESEQAVLREFLLRAPS